MKTRLIRVIRSNSSENVDDWVLPIHGRVSQQGPYELQPIEREGTAETRPTWRSLFAFTTRANWISIAASGTGTILAGLMKPVSSIFFGNIFSVLAKYGAGTMSAKVALHEISIWCIALTALGISAWVAEFIFLSSWITFGEIQAETVRNKLFGALLDKDLKWYDLREDGIGSLLIRIQT
jgi:ATP-binding cassette, subfamily B (MDR/TAP), member 1